MKFSTLFIFMLLATCINAQRVNRLSCGPYNTTVKEGLTLKYDHAYFNEPLEEMHTYLGVSWVRETQIALYSITAALGTSFGNDDPDPYKVSFSAAAQFAPRFWVGGSLVNIWQIRSDSSKYWESNIEMFYRIDHKLNIGVRFVGRHPHPTVGLFASYEFINIR